MDEAEWEMLRMRCEALARCTSASSQARQGDARVEKKRRTRGSGDVVPKVPSKLRGRSEAESLAELVASKRQEITKAVPAVKRWSKYRHPSKTFTIHWVPPTLNGYSRMHWRRQRQLVHTAGLYMMTAGMSMRVDDAETERVKVTFQFYRKKPTDRDNAIPKVICDAMVRLGWARDDNEEWMEQVVLPVKVDAKNPRTVIFIEPSKDYLEEV